MSWCKFLKLPQLAVVCVLPVTTSLAADFPINALVFDDASQLLIGRRGAVYRSNPPATTETRITEVSFSRIQSLAVNAEQSVLAIGGGEPGRSGALTLWDTANERSLITLENWDDVVTSVAFGAGGELAVASMDGDLILYKLNSSAGDRRPEPLVTLNLEDPILDFAFSHDGQHLFTAGMDRALKVWTVPELKLIRSLNFHTDPIYTLDIAPKNDVPRTYCVTGSVDGTARVWNPEIGRMVRIIRPSRAAILAARYSADGETLFLGGESGVIWHVDSGSDEILKRIETGGDWIYRLAVSKDGRWLAAGDWAGEVHLLELSAP